MSAQTRLCLNPIDKFDPYSNLYQNRFTPHIIDRNSMARVRMNPALTALSIQIMAKLCAFAKFSFMVGSKMAYFAPAAFLLPLVGAFGGISGSCAMLGLGLILRVLVYPVMPLAFVAYHLPGFFASLYWANRSKAARLIPVVCCVVLFLAHPLGAQNAWYSLFWLVPVIASFYTSLFATALGSSFTAHAVGTLVWLYAGQLSSCDFALLAPIVIVERLMIAVAMVLVYKLLVTVYSKVSASGTLLAPAYK